MRLSVGDVVANTYPVEVSGWDSTQDFFVEKSELQWNEENDRRLTLSRPLRPRTMIFVRLLQPVSADLAFPVAYQALPIENAEEEHQFRLVQVQPRCCSKDLPQ